MSHTHTNTYTVTRPANPFLVCSECRQRVEFWYDRPGPLVNEPCGHKADYENLCPSWGPVDACRCAEHLGHVPHPPARPSVTAPTDDGPRVSKGEQ